MFEWFCSNFQKNVDYLLLEGSTIGRTDKPFPTENELEEEFVAAFKQTKGIDLVYVSGQNIDRLITIYNACKKCNRTFLIDFYTANVLRTLSKKAKDNKIPFPSRETYPEIKVYYPQFLTKRMMDSGLQAEVVYPFTAHKIGRNKLDELADTLVMLVRPSVRYDLEHYLHNYNDGCLIYSMWDGYKTKPGSTKDFLDFITTKGMPIKDIHTSGHADLLGLKRMVEAVKPQNIVPIHTFEADKYQDLFSGTNILRVNDKEPVKA
jgi:ribonuclease J